MGRITKSFARCTSHRSASPGAHPISGRSSDPMFHVEHGPDRLTPVFHVEHPRMLAWGRSTGEDRGVSMAGEDDVVTRARAIFERLRQSESTTEPSPLEPDDDAPQPMIEASAVVFDPETLADVI